MRDIKFCKQELTCEVFS